LKFNQPFILKNLFYQLF